MVFCKTQLLYDFFLSLSILINHTILYTTVLHYRPLFQRVLAMTNHHTGMSLQAPGQEDFTIIQYNPDDQYTYAVLL